MTSTRCKAFRDLFSAAVANILSYSICHLLSKRYCIFAKFSLFSLLPIFGVSYCSGYSPVRDNPGIDQNFWSTSLAAGGGIWITKTSWCSENWKCKFSYSFNNMSHYLFLPVLVQTFCGVWDPCMFVDFIYSAVVDCSVFLLFGCYKKVTA